MTSTLLNLPPSSQISLRDYQASLLTHIYEQWQQHRRVLAVLPTGSGKTVLFSAIANDFVARRGSVLVLAHREELITQAADKLQAIASCDVGIIKAGHKPNYDAPIQVASVQSMARRMASVREPALIIVDEAHHSAAATYRRILERFDGAYQLGLTATPARLDGTGFDDLFDSLVCGPTVQELIDAGHLCPFKLYADPRPMRTGRKRCGDYLTSDLARENPVIELSGNLINAYRQRCPQARCLVFAVNIEHSQAIAQRYNQAGIPAVHLDGDTPDDERREALAKLASGQLKVISNCNLFSEGLDLPMIEAVQIASPTASLVKWLQMCGRALRPSAGKDFAILLDHTNTWENLGLPTRKRLWGLDGIKEPEKGNPLKFIEKEDGEVLEVEILEEETVLEAIAEEHPVIKPYLKRWFAKWEALLATREERGYEPGWLFYQLQEMKPPLELWQAYADLRGYRRGWAWHKWQQQQAA